MSSKSRHQASLILNVVLAFVVVVVALNKFARASASTPLPIQPGPIEMAPGVGQRKMASEIPALAEDPKLPQYADIKSPSDRRRSIIDQLRAMGAPNDVLALVARVDFEVQWDSRFEECHADMDKLAKVQLEMNMSKDAEMRAALGEQGFRQWDQKNMLWEAMSTPVDVTPEEASALYDLKKKLQQSQFNVEQARLKGTMDDAEINAAYDQSYSEYFQKMKTLLGDERYAKSQQLDDDFTSGNLRAQLAKVNPSDSQFQELFKAEKDLNQSRLDLDHQFQNDPSSPEYQARLTALNEVHDQEYQRILGTNTFTTLQQQQDPGYTQMKKYEDLWGLDDNKIDYVYSALKTYEKNLKDYQAQLVVLQAQGQSVSPDAVKKRLQQITDQTQQALKNYLGQDSFDKLARNRVFRFAQLQ